MKVIIAGSRTITEKKYLVHAIQLASFDITEVVSGGAKGVDSLGEEWAVKRGIPIKRFLPDYGEYGKRAPIERNKQMAQYADALIALWDGKSRGTVNMLNFASSCGLQIFRYTIGPSSSLG